MTLKIAKVHGTALLKARQQIYFIFSKDNIYIEKTAWAMHGLRIWIPNEVLTAIRGIKSQWNSSLLATIKNS